MDRHVYPNEERFYKEAEELGPWKVDPIVEEPKPKARSEGLWNLFLPESDHGAGLTNLEYAPLCEIMGRSHLAPKLFKLGARHRQHGSARALRHQGAEGALAEAAARRRNPLMFCNDQTGGGIK
jgi:Acyl-CoA dehydrogenase, N-terminal domain.